MSSARPRGFRMAESGSKALAPSIRKRCRSPSTFRSTMPEARSGGAIFRTVALISFCRLATEARATRLLLVIFCSTIASTRITSSTTTKSASATNGFAGNSITSWKRAFIAAMLSTDPLGEGRQLRFEISHFAAQWGRLRQGGHVVQHDFEAAQQRLKLGLRGPHRLIRPLVTLSLRPLIGRQVLAQHAH